MRPSESGMGASMTDRTHGAVIAVNPMLPAGDSTPLLQWFTQSEIDHLLKPQTQSEVNLYVTACARSSQNGIDSFNQYLWRTYYAAHGELTA